MSTPSQDQDQTPSSQKPRTPKNESGKPESGSEQLEEAASKRKQGVPPSHDEKTITGDEETIV